MGLNQNFAYGLKLTSQLTINFISIFFELMELNDSSQNANIKLFIHSGKPTLV